MAERGRYKTKQQEVILECLKKQTSRFLTVDQIMNALAEEQVAVGYTTVYRFLERLAQEGKVMKLPTEDGTKMRYCFADEEALGKTGKLVCLQCGTFIPMECSRLEELLAHISAEHGFELDRRHMVLYGYCENCKKRYPKIHA